MPARPRAVALVGLGLVFSLASASWRPAAAQNEAAGRKLAFLVGVKRYDHAALRDLDYPENDVTELAGVLKSQNFEIAVLTTAAAKEDPKLAPTAENIRARLTELLEHPPATKRDVILVGLAGHGLQPTGSKEAYFCPRDANPTIEDGQPQKPKTLVAIGEVLRQLDDSGIGYKLLMVDACRNDPSVRGRRGVERIDGLVLPPQTGVLLSCAPGEFSFEHKSLGTGHGVFFYHVIQGLKGAAKNADDSDISWDGLRTYVKRKVPSTVRSLYGAEGGEQRPNDIGNLIGEPTVLAIAPLGIRPDPRSEEPNKAMRRPGQPAGAPSGTFTGTHVGQASKDNGLGTTLIWISPGQFTMGSAKDVKGRGEDEDQVKVTLTAGFWLGQHEVTQAEWQRVMQTTPWSGKDNVKEGDDYPATRVSWDDAMKFCQKLTEQERSDQRLPSDWQYTLPTEAQWEYACRGGTTSRFSCGDDDSDLVDYAWYDKTAWLAGNTYAHTVGTKKANPWGLSDMHGNVWEWCRDWYAKELAGGANPQGPSEGSQRLHRGGSFSMPAGWCRSALRAGNPPDFRDSFLGFRIAAVPSSK